MWFPVRGAQSLGSLIFAFRPSPWGRKACALLLSVLCAVSGSLSLSAQEVAPASTETGYSASETGIADPRLDARVESLLHSMTLEEKIGQLV